MKKITAGQLLFALFLLVIGSVLLLINLNLISLEIKSIYLFLYPFFFLVLGLYWSVNGLIDRSKSKMFWGLFTLIFALLLISDRFGKIDFGFWDVFKLWPFLIIYWAIGLVFGKKDKFVVHYKSRDSSAESESLDDYVEYDPGRMGDEDSNHQHLVSSIKVNMDEIMETIERQIDNEKLRPIIVNKLREKIEQTLKPENITKLLRDVDGNELEDEDEVERKSSSPTSTTVNVLGFSVGDYEYKSPNWLLKPLKLENTIVNYYMDFTKAYIPEGETSVVLKGKIGDIELLIPEDVAIKVSVKNSIGDVSIFGNSSPNVGTSKMHYYESEEYEDAIKKVNFQITLSIGSVQIDQV